MLPRFRPPARPSVPGVRRPDARLEIAPYEFAAAARLAARAGRARTCSRRCWCGAGSATPAAARAFLAAGGRAPARRVRRAARGRRRGSSATSGAARGSPSTATTTSTASARPRCSCARCARSAPTSTGTCRAGSTTATASRAATVERLAARGTRPAGHRRLRDHRGRGGRRARAPPGMDVVVTDHHAPRADGALPDAPIVHPRLGGYPCPDLCAAGVALQARAGAARGARGRTRRWPTRTSTWSRSPPSPTSSRCTGENRRLVRAGPARARRARASPGCAR